MSAPARAIEGERMIIHEPVAPEPPRPLFRPSPAAEPFPVDALGSDLGSVVHAIIDLTQAPPAICANSVLAVASLTVQGRWDVRLPTGQTRPTPLMAMTIAASGERNTSAHQEELKRVREREHELRGLYPELPARHRNARDG